MNGVEVKFSIEAPEPKRGAPPDDAVFELVWPTPGDPSWLTPEELHKYIARLQSAYDAWRSLQADAEALRGRDIAEHAYRILDARGTPMHYRDVYEAIVAPGRRVAGEDPVANVLAAISNDDRIVSARPRSGLYKVR